MSTATVIETRPRVPIGDRIELARYTVSTSDRILHGQRINGVVRITDRPANGPGRSYIVERELEQEGHGAYAALEALVADYLAQARTLDAIPMATSIVARYLEALRA